MPRNSNSKCPRDFEEEESSGEEEFDPQEGWIEELRELQERSLEELQKIRQHMDILTPQLTRLLDIIWEWYHKSLKEQATSSE